MSMAKQLNASCKAKGPIKSDLAIPLVPEQLQAVLNYVAQDAKEALSTRRAYKKAKSAPTPKRANGEDQEGDQADEWRAI